MILEPVTGVRVRWLIRPGFGGWLAGAIIAWYVATQAGEALRAFLWS